MPRVQFYTWAPPIQNYIIIIITLPPPPALPIHLIMYLPSGTLYSSWQEGRAVPREQEFKADDDLYPMQLEPVYNGKKP